MDTNIKQPYLVPLLDIVLFQVEAGFINSIEQPIEDPEGDW